MEIEIVRVSPGMLPPTIKTTPNSPTVCAKLKTTPARMPLQESGTMTRKKVAQRDTPRHQDASTKRRSTPANAAMKGCTANGKVYRMEANKSPGKEKGNSRHPVHFAVR